MSTFGKKYLNHWNYNIDDPIRWNRTNKDFQLQLLHKWYPIGMKCHLSDDENISLFEIIGYQERLYGWILKVKRVNDKWVYEKHPLRVIQTKEDIRDSKLNKLI